MPSAEIIAVGTELLLGDIVDTNSQALGKELARLGFEHKRRATVGDHLERCTAVITEALQRSDFVFTIGGLGPTEDDLTRNAISTAVGESLVLDEDVLEQLRNWVSSRGTMWRRSYERQALRPQNSICLPNDAGTAPGIHWQGGGKQVIAMPGPRNEFMMMLENVVVPILKKYSKGVIYSKTLRILGMPESALGEMFANEMRSENPTVSPYAKLGEVHLRITAKANSEVEAAALIDPVAQAMAARLRGHLYSEEGESLAEVIVKLLSRNKANVAVAESCTGGLLGSTITSVPGASEVFCGGMITYANSAKVGLLNVVAKDLQMFGAVSSEIAEQMATNVRNKFQSDFGLSITGIAGPGGATEKKPVGLVYIGLATTKRTLVEESRFRGGRDHIRELSVQRALSILWRALTA